MLDFAIMRALLATIVVLLTWFSAAPVFGQQHNYTQGDIEEGRRLFRLNCIGCHGPEGNLVGGIDLGRGRFRRVTTDEEIAGVIVNGVPGTGMPPIPVSALRASFIVAYMRNMNASVVESIAAASGDADRGKVLFDGKGGCIACHRVRGEGSRGGPDLTQTGLRLRAIEIETAILEPDMDISTTNRTFRGIQKNGTTITGLLLNQDMFTVQMLDASGNLISLQRSTLRESGVMDKSAMPSYKDKLNPQELADLIAYVSSLKGL